MTANAKLVEIAAFFDGSSLNITANCDKNNAKDVDIVQLSGALGRWNADANHGQESNIPVDGSMKFHSFITHYCFRNLIFQKVHITVEAFVSSFLAATVSIAVKWRIQEAALSTKNRIYTGKK